MPKSTDKYTKSYQKDFDAQPKERKHIILLDGTLNDETGLNADGLVTNIVNLKRLLVDEYDNQIVRYHRGVGNDNDNSWVKSRWKGATGKAIATIIEKAYARFVQDWQKGDRIYIFGFSRGAAAARILASKIAENGVPNSISITLIPIENKETKVIEQTIYHVQIDDSKKQDVDIEFLGVWDTVSALGLGNNFLRFWGIKSFYKRKIGNKTHDLFLNDTIASNIKKAVHIVAIDETRNIFVPSLMNQKEKNEEVIQEIWFPGVHSDVGGSYEEDEIAKVTLYYMIEQLELWNKSRSLNEFSFNPNAYNKHVKSRIDNAYFHFHGKATGKDLRAISVQTSTGISNSLKPKIHKLYKEITSSKKSYSVVEMEGEKGEKETKSINFQYMPFNVKVLEGEYIIVS